MGRDFENKSRKLLHHRRVTYDPIEPCWHGVSLILLFPRRLRIGDSATACFPVNPAHPCDEPRHEIAEIAKIAEIAVRELT